MGKGPLRLTMLACQANEKGYTNSVRCLPAKLMGTTQVYGARDCVRSWVECYTTNETDVP